MPVDFWPTLFKCFGQVGMSFFCLLGAETLHPVCKPILEPLGLLTRREWVVCSAPEPEVQNPLQGFLYIHAIRDFFVHRILQCHVLSHGSEAITIEHQLVQDLKSQVTCWVVLGVPLRLVADVISLFAAGVARMLSFAWVFCAAAPGNCVRT